MKHCPQCSTGYPDSLAACPTHGVPLNEIRDLKPGMVIHHSYRIVRKLGQGGMGAVYLAQHTLMDEPRALKFLSAELSSDQAFTARFLREVRTLRQIRNRNVVDCGDLERAEDDSLFFSMEFVDGPDLRRFLHDAQQYQDSDCHPDLLHACHPERSAAESKDLRLHSADEINTEGGGGFNPRISPQESTRALAPEALYQSTAGRSGLQPRLPQMPQIEARALASAGSLPVPLALHIARNIAQGLAAAHARGMVHRDIKPENILMAREAAAWLPKIADFGIVATKESSAAFTRTGGTLLTVTYAAPEQWRGTPAADLDGRTDLYALGGLLYEMLTGQTVFHALNYEGWAWQHQNTPPPSPSTLRPDLANWQGLDALVLRLLAKDREDRPKDVAETITLLGAVVYVPPPTARPPVAREISRTVVEKGGERAAVHVPAWVWAVCVAVLLVAAFATGRIFGPKPPKPPQETSAQTTLATQPQPTQPRPEQDTSPNPSDTRLIAQPEQGPQTAAVPGATASAATLLVTCDLACRWSLDGEAKGRIDANGTAKAKVEPGQHLVIATTDDGADQVKQLIEIKANGQSVVTIELKPVRDARLKAEQEARDKAAREQTAREEVGKVWADPATGLMWAKKDNGGDVNWQQASDYCWNLRLAGHSGWRLATIDELQSIYDPNRSEPDWQDGPKYQYHVKGQLQLSGWEWSSSQGNAFGEAWGFYFGGRGRHSYRLGDRSDDRALCVRRSGE